jgi:hypothetical protein
MKEGNLSGQAAHKRYMPSGDPFVPPVREEKLLLATSAEAHIMDITREQARAQKVASIGACKVKPHTFIFRAVSGQPICVQALGAPNG